MQTRRMFAAGLAAAVMSSIGAASVAARQTQSPALAKELVAELTKRKLDCVLAKDPQVTGQYVAALNVSGVQLLVVSAKFADPAGMEFRVFSSDCMGGYADLNAAVTATDRLAISDVGADGLVAMPKKNTPRDSVTRGGQETKLDGSNNALKAAKMTAADYDKLFADSEATYANYLKLLLARLKG